MLYSDWLVTGAVTGGAALQAAKTHRAQTDAIRKAAFFIAPLLCIQLSSIQLS
jgi:hypothetical protein